MKAVVATYLQLFPGERTRLQGLLEFLRVTPTGPSLYDRLNFSGHITAGGFVLSPDGARLAFVKHKFLGRYLQPGGHIEAGDCSVIAAAEREVAEETGLHGCLYIPFHGDPSTPLDIDSHFIPANPGKNEPGHFHHDFRFLFQANAEIATGECEWKWMKKDEALREEMFDTMRSKIA